MADIEADMDQIHSQIAVATLVAASRVVTGAHYLSDTIFGAFVAVLTARGLAILFARGFWGLAVDRLRRGAVSPVSPTVAPGRAL